MCGSTPGSLTELFRKNLFSPDPFTSTFLDLDVQRTIYNCFRVISKTEVAKSVLLIFPSVIGCLAI